MSKKSAPSILLVVMLSGCVATTGPITTIDVIKPAASSRATQAKKIAVLPFDGDQNRNFTSEIESALANLKVGDSPYFQVVERDKIDRITREIKFSQSGLVNKDSAKKAGHISGASALYAGNILQPRFNTSNYREKRSVCVKKSEPKGFLKIQTCLRYDEISVLCSKTEVTFTFTPKVIETQSANILFSDKITGTAQESSCKDSETPARTQDQLLATAKESAINQFISKVAPTSSKVDLHLMDSVDGIKNELVIKKINQGIEFAKVGRMDRACEFWNEASNISPEESTILFNLGVCAEAENKLDVAEALYNKVDRRLEKPDSRVSEALRRIKEKKIHKSKILDQIKPTK